MQVTGQDAERSILFEMTQASIGTTVQTVMFQAIDGGFYCGVLLTQSDEGFAVFTLVFVTIEFAFFGQD